MSRLTINSDSEESSGDNSDTYLRVGPEPEDSGYLDKMAKSNSKEDIRLF